MTAVNYSLCLLEDCEKVVILFGPVLIKILIMWGKYVSMDIAVCEDQAMTIVKFMLSLHL